MEILVNGKKYEQVQQPNRRSSNYAAFLLAQAMFMTSAINSSGKASMPRFSDGELVREFELIELKKSTLPRAQRDYIVNQFNKKFKPI